MNPPDQYGPTGDCPADPPATQPIGPAARPVPQVVGRYRVVKVLGQGGFGSVFLAYDDQLERQVAIKLPHAERM